MNWKRLSGATVWLTILMPVMHAAGLTQFDQLVVFGDSLSDTGNVTIATGGQFPGPNYAPGRFTDGPTTTPGTTSPVGLWVDQLAGKLGVPDPQPFLALTGGTDYAFASATTGSNGLYDISDQLKYFAAANLTGIDPKALIAVWGGANDLFNASTAPKTAADNLYANILSLAAGGGKTFLWFDLPPLGITPRAALEGDSAALTAATLTFNSEWATDITLLKAAGINVVGVDIYSLFGSIAANPSAYGFSNLTTPAQGLANVDPNTYLFWDIQHPTTAGHAAVANLAYADLAVPEPAAYAITGLGLFLVLVRRARSGARRPQAS